MTRELCVGSVGRGGGRPDVALLTVLAVTLLVVGEGGCGGGRFVVPEDGPKADQQQVDGRPDGPKADQQQVDGGVVPGTWVTIAKGTFTMGSPASEPCRVGTHEDQHQVTLTRGFELQSTEVTQGQFSSVMGYNPSYFGPGGAGANCGTNCPVERVNWHEAVAYCNALSQKAGKATCYACSGSGKNVTCQEATAYSGQKVYTCPGYRLPTEAEWEYAERAGTTTAYYSGVNEAGKCSTCSSKDPGADKMAWYCANAGGTTHPVGQKQKNAWGLYDMAGNVWEWCHDWSQSSLGSSPVTDPWESTSGSSRVLRGGSCNNNALNMRGANRFNSTPTNRGDSIGFRCCRTSAGK